ncbi:MAG: RsmG family class I SAM-dependent methyltransferase [Myxococcota bacterium]|nr:RsmG family class I SAM-dependent methyltransferase [Myxococcota bacterium]
MQRFDHSQLLEQAGLNTRLSSRSIDLIDQYFSARDRWSRTHNVAGPKALMSPYEVDLVDAVALAECLSASDPLVDVGTGSGTPGLLIACLRPEQLVILVEPIAKRTAFLRHVRHALGLPNVQVVRSRWPCTLSADAIQIVSRAVVDPEDWPALAVRTEAKITCLYRMLAANRPSMTLSAWRCVKEVDYELPAKGLRRIECWRLPSGG